MTILIKSAAGKLLKAEGKIWDQNSVADCDCPCLDNSFDCETHTLTRANINCTDGSGGAGKWGVEWTATSDYDDSTISGEYILTFPELCASWSLSSAGVWSKTVDEISNFTESAENCSFSSGPISSIIVAASPIISGAVRMNFDNNVSLKSEEKLTIDTNPFGPPFDTLAHILDPVVSGAWWQFTENCITSGCCDGTETHLYPYFNNFRPIYNSPGGYGNSGNDGYAVIPTQSGYSVEITAEHTPVFSLELKGTED